ncbi:hypothetical protein D3C87_301180 [compost metagenome]
MKFLAMALISGLFSVQAFAADSSSGCGPGWYLFKENSLVSSALRGTTNAVLFPVTTIGMTVGTSNCTQHKLVLKEKESLHFATMNHFELKNEIAKGQGEYVSAFATTMGCPSQAQMHLNKSLQKNFKNIYNKSEVDPSKVLLEVYKVILTDPKLTQQCSLSA